MEKSPLRGRVHVVGAVLSSMMGACALLAVFEHIGPSRRPDDLYVQRHVQVEHDLTMVVVPMRRQRSSTG